MTAETPVAESVAQQLLQEKEATEARLQEQAQSRLREVDEQIGPLQQERGELVGFLGLEEPNDDAQGARPSAPEQPRRRRRRKGGTRGEQAVEVIRESPGISASEVASRLGIKPNYLYRVLSEQIQEGTVKKEGQVYNPA